MGQPHMCGKGGPPATMNNYDPKGWANPPTLAPKLHGANVGHHLRQGAPYGFSGLMFSMARMSQPVEATASFFDMVKSPLKEPFTE